MDIVSESRMYQPNNLGQVTEIQTIDAIIKSCYVNSVVLMMLRIPLILNRPVIRIDRTLRL